MQKSWNLLTQCQNGDAIYVNCLQTIQKCGFGIFNIFLTPLFKAVVGYMLYIVTILQLRLIQIWSANTTIINKINIAICIDTLTVIKHLYLHFYHNNCH